MRKTKFKLSALISFFLCVVVCLTAALSLLFSDNLTAKAYSAEQDATVNEIWQGGKNPFSGDNLKTLYGQLVSGATKLDDVAKTATYDGTPVASKNIVIKFGGKVWVAVYLSKADTAHKDEIDTAPSGDGLGIAGKDDIVLTLWLAYSSDKAKWNENYSSTVGTYPSNMYGTSYMRSQVLNNGGEYWKDISTLQDGAKSDSNPYGYSPFTTVKPDTPDIADYLVAPRYIDWQYSQSSKTSARNSYDLNNDAWGTDEKTNFYSSSSYKYYYRDKTDSEYYTAWKDDLLWLPSLAETGYGTSGNQGLWQTTLKQRQNSTSAWLRSGFYSDAYRAYGLSTSGSYNINFVSDEYVVRPALHLNLTSAAGAAGAVLPEKPTTGLTKEVPYDGNEQEFELPELEGVTYSAVAAGDSTDFFQNDPVAKTKKIVATNAGEYKVEVTPPEDGWKDGTKDPVTFTLKITKAKIGEDWSGFSKSQDYVYHADDNKYALKLPEIGEEGFPLSLVGKDTLSAGDIKVEYIIDTHEEGGHDTKKAEIEAKITKANGGDPSELDALGSWTAYSKGGKCGTHDFDVNKPLGYCVIFKAQANDNFETLYGYFSVHIFNEKLTIKLTKPADLAEVEYGEVAHTQSSLRTKIFADIPDTEGIVVLDEDGSVLEDRTTEFKDEAQKEKFIFYYSDGSNTYDIADDDDGTRLDAGKTYYLYVKYVGDGEDGSEKYITFDWQPGRPSFKVTPREIEIDLNVTGSHKYQETPPVSWATATPKRATGKSGEWYGKTADNNVTNLKLKYKFKKSDGTGSEYTALSKDMPAGTYNITVESGNDNYVIKATTPVTPTYTVGKATYTIEFEAASEEYTGEEIKHEISSLPDGVTATYSYEGKGGTSYGASATAPKNAGTYKVTATFTITDTDNYEVPDDITVDLTITPKKLYFSLEKSSGEYTGEEHDGIDVTFETLADGDSLTKGVDYELEFAVDGEGALGTGNLPQDKGTYKVTVKLKDTVKNYVMEDDAEATYSITLGGIAKPTGTDIDETYKGEDYELKLAGFDKDTMSGSASAGAAFDEDTGVFSAKNFGTYTLTVSLADEDNTQWDDGTTKDITFTIKITKAKLTFTVSPISGAYTGSEHDVTVDFGKSLKGTDTLSADDYEISYAVTPSKSGVLGANGKPQGVGSYTVTVTLKDTDATKNYEMADGASAEYTITAGGIAKPTGDDINDNYKGADYELTVSGYDKDKMNYSITGSGAAFDPESGKFTAKNAGEYKLSVTLKGSEYVWSTGGTEAVVFTITINKVTLTVTAEDKEVVYGTTPTYTVTYSGFVSGESQTTLGYTATASSTYTFANGIGDSFEITVNAPQTLANYDVTTVAGTLKVTPKAITLKINDGGHAHGGTPQSEFTLTDVNGELVAGDTTAVFDGKITFYIKSGGSVVALDSSLEVGEYELCADDGNYGNYTVTFTSGRYIVTNDSIAAPTADPNAGNFTYTGDELTYMPEGFDPLTMEIEGNENVQTNAGEYIVKVYPKDRNLVFETAEGPKDHVEFTFEIKPAEIVKLNDNGNSFIQDEVTGGGETPYAVTLGKKKNGKFANFDAVGGQEITIYATKPLPYDNDNKPVRPEFALGDYIDITELDTDDPDYPLNVDVKTVGKYVVYYHIVAPNHEDLDGEWRVEVAKDSEVVKVVFKKAYEIPYGVTPDPEDIFEDIKAMPAQYLSVTKGGEDFTSTFFNEIAQGVSLGCRRINEFGKYSDSGEYYINFKLAENSVYTVIYREGGNNPEEDTNFDKLKITQRELALIWDTSKLSYTFTGDAITLDGLATLDGAMADDWDGIQVRFELSDHNQVITAEGEYQVTAVLVGANARNYRFSDEARVVNTVVVTAAPSQESENDDGGGIPWWVWLIVGLGVALVIAAIVIAVVVAKRKKPEKEVVIRDINSDDDGFYDDADGNDK